MWEKIKTFFQTKIATYQANRARLAAIKPNLETLEPPLTRKEYQLTGRGKYELDPQTRKLTSFGRMTRLKHKLNMAILTLVVLIALVYIILIFF